MGKQTASIASAINKLKEKKILSDVPRISPRTYNRHGKIWRTLQTAAHESFRKQMCNHQQSHCKCLKHDLYD